jgi:hypothetical protein
MSKNTQKTEDRKYADMQAKLAESEYLPLLREWSNRVSRDAWDKARASCGEPDTMGAKCAHLFQTLTALEQFIQECEIEAKSQGKSVNQNTFASIDA